MHILPLDVAVAVTQTECHTNLSPSAPIVQRKLILLQPNEVRAVSTTFAHVIAESSNGFILQLTKLPTYAASPHLRVSDGRFLSTPNDGTTGWKGQSCQAFETIPL